MQLLSEPPGNRDVPRVCNTACNKGPRDRPGAALERLLTGRTRASNEDHTLRHINPAIVRGGSGSEARTENSKALPVLQYQQTRRCGMCRSGYSAVAECLRQLQCQAGR